MLNQTLAYHKIRDEWEWGLTVVSPHRFKAQIDYFARRGLEFVTVSHLNPNKAQLAITFDDGYQSVYRTAFPILQPRGILATVFPVVDFINRANSWDYQLGRPTYHLSWDELRELVQAGWEVGSHGLTHRRLAQLPLSEIQKEVRESKQRLEDKLGCRVTSFCPPFGSCSAALLEEVFAAGYERCVLPYQNGCLFTAFSSRLVPRLNVYRHEPLSWVKAKVFWSFWTPIVVFQQMFFNLANRGTAIFKQLAGDWD